MALNNIGFPYDATNSWNGYNHQGKIALWYTINQINELWDSLKSKDNNLGVLGDYYLELEYLEDFSIFKIDGGEKNYLTIHQVKSREDTSINAYDEAILNLVVKLINYPTIEHSYLHVTKQLELGGKSFAKNVQDIIDKSNKIDKMRTTIENNRNDKSFREKFYGKIVGKTTNLKKSILYALHESNPNETEINEENLDKAFEAYLAASSESLQRLRAIGEKQLKKVALCEYPDINDGSKKQNFCGANNAEKLLKNAICHIFETTDSTGWRNHNDEYQEKVYLSVLGKLDKHIIERQVNAADYKSGKKDRAISFRTIFEWLDEDCSKLGESYYLYYIKESYFNKMDGFCDGCQKKNDCKKCYLIEAKNKIGAMTFDKLKRFAFMTSPNVGGDINIENYALFAGNSGLTDPFSKGLRDLHAAFKDDTEIIPISYIDDDKKQYTLTTIIAEGRDDDKCHICTEILRNQNVYSMMMDCDVLISKGVKSDSIQQDAQDITNLDGTEFEKSAEYISHCKKVRIECLDECKKKFTKEGA